LEKLLFYFQIIIKERGKEAITDQAVPLEPELLELSNYKKFLEKRRDLLKSIVNKFLEDVLI